MQSNKIFTTKILSFVLKTCNICRERLLNYQQACKMYESGLVVAIP